jgi:hypothetical protein
LPPYYCTFLWKRKDMDFSKASWFLLGFGVEVGLAPNTPPTLGFKDLLWSQGVCKGNRALYFGERSIFRFLCWVGGVPHVPKYWWWPNQMGPSETQNVVAPPHQLTKVWISITVYNRSFRVSKHKDKMLACDPAL